MLKSAALFVAASLISAATAVPDIAGRASVVDGDTFDIGNVRVRLHGIDAPESWQRCLDSAGQSYRCGKVAADLLDHLLAESRPVRCEFRSFDRNRRFVGQCFRADGQDVAAMLVRAGYALDWKRYSHGQYAAEEKAASMAKAGMWSGSFLPPWEVR